MAKYLTFKGSVITGENTDAGSGWCGVVESRVASAVVINVYGNTSAYETEESLLTEIAENLKLPLFLIALGRVSAKPGSISLDKEYLI